MLGGSIPLTGVFAVRVTGAGGQPLNGVANLGVRPTVGGEMRPLLEVHLFDFAGDLYGRQIDVSFIDFIRPERKFDGLESLRTQITADGEEARRILAAASAP